MKLKKIFISFFLLILIFMTGCTPKHNHEYSSEWAYDDEYHYHQAICEHNDLFTSKSMHTWDSGSVIKEATTTQTGLKEFKCTVCNATKEEVIEMLVHVHDIVNHEGKAATCVDAGYEPYQTCKNCDYTTYKQIKALGHDLVEHEGKDATCLEDGFYPYETCQRCNYSNYEVIKALGHDFGTSYNFDKTNHWLTCKCGAKDKVNAHTWDSGKIVKEATTIEEGKIVYNCTVCDATKEGKIDKISTDLVICGYNTQKALSNIDENEGIRLFKANVTPSSSLYWLKIAIKYVNGNYVVSEVAKYGKSLTAEYEYVILAYNNIALETANFEVGDIILFSSKINNITTNEVSISFVKATGNEKFEVSYELGYEQFNTKDDLYEAYFTDYYNFLIEYTNVNMSLYNIEDVSDFLVFCKTWDANGRNELAGVGNAFGSYYLKPTEGGNFADQPTTCFIGYCYQNNMYLDFLEFLEVFFAYWRTDEGYTTSTNHGNDFFYSSWAAFVDTCKFFYFTSETITEKYKWFTETRSPRVHYALDHVPGVGEVNLEYTSTINCPIVLPELSRMYYTFLGWFDSEGNKVTTVASNMTVYAKFSRNKHTVIFTDGTNKIKEVVNEGLRIKNIPTLESNKNEFIGWILDDYTTYDYLNGVVEDLTFYALWQNSSSEIGKINVCSFNSQSATSSYEQYMGLRLYKAGITPGSSLYWHKVAIKLVNSKYVVTDIVLSGDAMPSDYDYILLVYKNDTSGKYQDLLDLNIEIGNTVLFNQNLNSLSNGEVDLTVTFTKDSRNIYSLILVDNGADHLEYNCWMYENDNITLPVPTKAGYNFDGWYLNESFNGDRVSTITAASTNVTLYAKWSTISLDNVLSLVSDVVTSNTCDILPSTFNGSKLTWTSEDTKLYEIKDGKGYTNRLYQTHQKQTVKISVEISDGNSSITKSKTITIDPVLFDDMTNPKATYFSVSSTYHYKQNNERYKKDNTLFSDKFKSNMDMIYYAFAIPQSDGTLTLDTSYLNEVKELKNSGIRVLLVIDGANKTPLQAMVQACNNDSTRSTFVNNIISLITKYNFDGVDIDWEFPGTSGLSEFTTELDQTNLNKLLRDLRTGLDNIQDKNGSPYIISVAIPSTSWGSVRYDFKGNSTLGGINTYCDYVNMMSYDLNKASNATHVSGCYSSTNSNDYKFGCVYGVNQFTSLGLDKNKIILGAAAYGKAYNITGTVNQSATYPALGVSGTLTSISGVIGSYSSGTIYYTGVASLLKDPNYVKYTEYNNGKVVGSYLYNKTNNIFITYDSEEGIKEKCNYAKANGLGIMVWAYGEDATDTLINTICDNL